MNTERILKKAIQVNNQKQHYEMLNILNNKTGFMNELARIRAEQTYRKSGKATRLVASVPEEVHTFFIKVFGQDYYKDKDFFTKRFSEWSVHKEGDSLIL